MELASPLTTLDKVTKIQKVYGYNPHIEIAGGTSNPSKGNLPLDTTQLIKLQVPYFQQNDNDASVFGAGWRQCNTTSTCMLADYLLQGALTKSAKEEGSVDRKR